MPGYEGAGHPNSSPYACMASALGMNCLPSLLINLTILFNIPEARGYTLVLLFKVMFVLVRLLSS